MQHLLVESGHQKWLAGHVRLHRALAPRTTPSRRLAPLPQIVHLAEPDSGLRLSRQRVRALIRSCLVAAQREHAAERAIIRDRAQMLADGLHAPYAVLKRDRLQLIEHPVNVHQKVLGFHFPYAHPLRLPGVLERVARLGKPVQLPVALHQRPKQNARLIPTGAENNVAHVLAARAIHVRFFAEAAPALAVVFE